MSLYIVFLAAHFSLYMTEQDLHTQFLLMVSYLIVFSIEMLRLLMGLVKIEELCLSPALVTLSCLQTNLVLNLYFFCEREATNLGSSAFAPCNPPDEPVKNYDIAGLPSSRSPAFLSKHGQGD